MAADTDLRSVSAASSRSASCCGCLSAAANQVQPLQPLDDSYQLLELRPNRFICVHHHNARERDKIFDEEMRNFMKTNVYGAKYRPSSIPAYKYNKNLSRVAKKQDISHPVNADGCYADPHRPQSPDDIISPSHLTTTLDAQSRDNTQVSIATNNHSNGANGNTLTMNGNAGALIQKKLSKSVIKSTDNNSKKPVIFLIHGVGGSAQVWKAQIDHFSSLGYEVVAMELLGHGHSSVPKCKEEYSFLEIMIDVFLVFDMHCKEENIVIGHSYGACFAAVLARRRDQLVQKLVMISGGAPTPLAPQPGLFSLPICALACLQPIVRRGFNKTAFYKHKHVADSACAFAIPNHVLKHVMNGQHWPEGDASYHCRISCPTLLIHGAHDKLISIEEELEMTDAIYGSILHVLEDASHMVMMEQPTQVNAILAAFIMGNDAPSDDVTMPANDVTTNTDDVMKGPQNSRSGAEVPIADDVSSIESCNSAILETYHVANAKSASRHRQSSAGHRRNSAGRRPPTAMERIGSREHSVYVSPKHGPRDANDAPSNEQHLDNQHLHDNRRPPTRAKSARSVKSIPSNLVTGNF